MIPQPTQHTAKLQPVQPLSRQNSYPAHPNCRPLALSAAPSGNANPSTSGYQVIKKWLSYREKKLLGRSMKMEEVEYLTEMARRLAAIVLLQPKLDENYRTVKSNTYLWPAAFTSCPSC